MLQTEFTGADGMSLPVRPWFFPGFERIAQAFDQIDRDHTVVQLSADMHPGASEAAGELMGLNDLPFCSIPCLGMQEEAFFAVCIEHHEAFGEALNLTRASTRAPGASRPFGGHLRLQR